MEQPDPAACFVSQQPAQDGAAIRSRAVLFVPGVLARRHFGWAGHLLLAGAGIMRASIHHRRPAGRHRRMGHARIRCGADIRLRRRIRRDRRRDGDTLRPVRRDSGHPLRASVSVIEGLAPYFPEKNHQCPLVGIPILRKPSAIQDQDARVC